MIKELTEKAVRFITIIMNSIIRIGHFPSQWKVAQIILIPKPGKNSDLVTSYRPISLLPILSKLCEKIILRRLNVNIMERGLIPDIQFGFRNKHSTIEQVNRVTKTIRDAIEDKKYCSAIFLDIEQAFDKVWHEGLLLKLSNWLPKNHFNIIKSYLENRTFQVKMQNSVTKLYWINIGVPQGSVLGPVLYLLYTADFPTETNITTAIYADDTAALSTNTNANMASDELQKYVDKIYRWYKLWRIKVNESKSTHVTFTLRRETCPNIQINGIQIPQSNHVKYLGLHLDRRLTWREHIWTKRKQLNLKIRKMFWLMGRKSRLSLESKLILYKCVIKPIWTYGIQLWGKASKTNLEIIERFQSKCLRDIVQAPWFVPNELIRKDLKVITVQKEIDLTLARYKKRLANHQNKLATVLLTNRRSSTRLKKYKYY